MQIDRWCEWMVACVVRLLVGLADEWMDEWISYNNKQKAEEANGLWWEGETTAQQATSVSWKSKRANKKKPSCESISLFRPPSINSPEVEHPVNSLSTNNPAHPSNLKAFERDVLGRNRATRSCYYGVTSRPPDPSSWYHASSNEPLFTLGTEAGDINPLSHFLGLLNARNGHHL